MTRVKNVFRDVCNGNGNFVSKGQSTEYFSACLIVRFSLGPHLCIPIWCKNITGKLGTPHTKLERTFLTTRMSQSREIVNLPSSYNNQTSVRTDSVNLQQTAG